VENTLNVVVILFDDLKFSHFECYGSTIDKPNIDRLAANGVRFSNFHTTPLCSPTTASLLTGSNHQTVGMGTAFNINTGYPNRMGNITHQAATIAEMLKECRFANGIRKNLQIYRYLMTV